jgi:hypothetical protein
MEIVAGDQEGKGGIEPASVTKHITYAGKGVVVRF